ncbi:synaptophysin-like protein 1 isoform X1 [Acipenser ruthenus]|uniref:synaptophysin-like protein 1 isoform X1 n=2 Tax=Acipenser ruthenus TaxID=7906 RepID=UPI00145B4E31|nr:synaptophysin-like protein 1 isoform X1 [Acipenser ruthenus]
MDSLAQKMTGLQLNFRPIMEPLGFIKILEWIFAIFAFATCGGYSGKSVISVFCRDGPNATLNVNFSYPFKLNQVVLVPSGKDICNRTLQETHLIGDSSSSAEFFVSVAVFAFLYCIAALVLYVGYLHVYNESNRGPMIDFVVTCLFAFFWLVSSSAWAQGLRNVKTSIGIEGIRETLSACKEDGITCDVTSFANMGGLSVSVVFGFLNLILWVGNAWFAFKETSWHTPPQTGSTTQQGSESVSAPPRM